MVCILQMKNYIRLFIILSVFLISFACDSSNSTKKSDVTEELNLPEILKEGNQHYLPDFSYAGYKWGEEPLPEPTGTIINITDYGAVADDSTDDTTAIMESVQAASAIDENTPVILKFPKGRFILKEIIFIKRSNIVLLGEGSGTDGTTIYIPVPLKEMALPAEIQDKKTAFENQGRTTSTGAPYSYFSWIGGVIWTDSDKSTYYPGKYVISGKRGGNTITVNDDYFNQDFVGKLFQVRWYNDGHKDSDLIKHILDNQDVEVGQEYEYIVNGEYTSYTMLTQTMTATAINGNTLTIKEELAHDIRPEWTQKVAFNNYLENVGIQGFAIEFPQTDYPGHHEEEGYNGIYLTELIHSWVKDIKITNADSGILTERLKHVTILDTAVEGRGGHYTVSVGSCNYVLIKNFNFLAKALHNPSFNSSALLNVYTNGFIMEPQLDQHCGMNHQNLFDNIRSESDDVENLFDHGGNSVRGPTAGAFNTFWNIYVQSETSKTTTIDDAPSARIIGLTGSQMLELTYGPNAYIEKHNTNDLEVPSLYEYQLKKRLKL